MVNNPVQGILFFIAGLFVTGYVMNTISSFYKKRGISRSVIGKSLPSFLATMVYVALFFLSVVLSMHVLRWGIYMYEYIAVGNLFGAIRCTIQMFLQTALITLVLEEPQ